ncbi:MAG: alpha/beta fold hydrolase [Tumebacillaceae bacterium]
MAIASNFQSGFAEVHGTKMYYEIMGEGPALVLNHPVGLDNRIWDAQVAELATQYKVIRYDMRGFGQTAMVNEPFSIHGDLLGLLQQLNVEKASIVGVSFGAYAALEFVLAHPDMVDALVLCNSSLLGFPRSEETLAANAAFGEALQRGDFAKAVELSTNMSINGLNQPVDRVSADVRAKYGEIVAHAFTLPFIPNPPQWLEPSPITRLEEIQAPTLVIIGELDLQENHDIADLLTEKINGAKHLVFPETAHFPNMEQPEAFNRIVLDFLATVQTVNE